MRQLYLILVLLLIPSLVLAEPVEISINPQSATIEYRRESNFTLEVTNNQNFTDTFTFKHIGAYSQWVSYYNTTVTVKNNSKENITFVIFPTNDIGKYVYQLTTQSKKNSSVNDTQDLAFTVFHPEGVLLKEYYPRWQGKIFPNFFVKTVEKRLVTVLMEIIDQNGKIVEKTSASKEIDGEGNVFEFVEIGSLDPGKYTLKSQIEGTSVVKEQEIEIESNESVKIDRKVDSNPLFQEVKISITNLGNTPQKNYQVFETLGVGTPVNFITKFSGLEKLDDQIKYEFKVAELKPGDTVEIVYRIEYWQGMLITLILIIIALGVMIWYVNRLRNPRIRKKYLKKKTGFTVVLEIRGSMFNDLKNVTIRDWVSPLAKVKQNFETLKPVVRGSDVGTELIWKLGDLAKGEDRVIHYDIEPVQLSTIKLDKAWMRYSKTEDKQYKKFSNVIVVDASNSA